MLSTRLHFGRHAEHPGVLEAISRLEVIERLMEHEERFAADTGQALFQTRIQGIQAFAKGLQVALVACGIGRIGSAEVGSHLRCDHPGIGRRQPEVGIETAWAMVVIVFVAIFVMRVAIFAKVAQVQAGQVLHRDTGFAAALEHPRQEAFHVRADPVQQLDVTHPPYVGGTQCVVMRGGAWRQQHFRAANAVLNCRGDLLQGLDTGQDTDLGLCLGHHQSGDKSDKKGKKSGHDDHSKGQEQVT
ncbi:hypothetical protein D3C77_475270 [compost metagenome]